MEIWSTCVTKTKRLSFMAVAVAVAWLAGTHTQLDAAPAWPSLADLPQPQLSISADKDSKNPIQILSAVDAALYRAAFAAQSQNNTESADQALSHVKDKRLTGHVLADRYLRGSMDLAQARDWMTANADLPEASDIYKQASRLKGFKDANIMQPIAVTEWSGNGVGLGASSGFRSQSVADVAAKKTKLYSKINAQLHHGDPDKARILLTTEMQRGTLSSQDSGDIVSRIAAAFYYDGEVARARSMAHMAANEGVPLGLWIDGLASWKQKDYPAATRSFASLAQAPGLTGWDHAAASFWAYRAAHKTGDEAQAKHWLLEAAKSPRTFYGAMAVSLAGHSAGHSWKMPELTAENTDILSHMTAGWQALALTQIGQTEQAENEMRRLNPTGRRDLQNAMMALADKGHMPSLTLELASVASDENGQIYEAAQYPVPGWQPEGGFKVDRALIFALMKHESHFDPDAVSQSGACGLMQLMPATARTISDDNSMEHARGCPTALLDPKTNLDLGQKYVRVLGGQPVIGDNLVLLLAAYNGGPGNLNRWLDGEDRKDPLLFMESLPVRETRDYVQQVLMQYWMYRSRLGNGETAVATLARGEWPRYEMNAHLELASYQPAR
jgi:soluble lytic murein transglycosylase